MKIFVKVLQVALALWTTTGSIYMMGHYELLASSWAANTLPSFFWIILGIVQLILSLGLLISVKESMRKYATPSALGLAVIVLAGLFLYSAYVGSGVLWAIIPSALLAFVAYTKKS